jgi:hypothetical protein
MARKVNAFLMTFCLLFASDAKAISGNEWKRLDPGEQRFYVVGVVDAWQHLEQVASHAFSQTALGKRSSPVGEQLVLIISAHDNFRRLVDLLGG